MGSGSSHGTVRCLQTSRYTTDHASLGHFLNSIGFDSRSDTNFAGLPDEKFITNVSAYKDK